MSCQFFVPRDFCRKILEHTVNISEKLTTTQKSNFTTDFFQKKKMLILANSVIIFIYFRSSQL